MQTKAVIFDRDNTLLTTDHAQLTRIQVRLESLAPGLSIEVLGAAWERWPGPWPRSVGEEPAFWLAFCAAVAREHGHSTHVEQLAIELDALYHTCFCAFPDAAPTLAALRALGLRLAVLSNFELPSIDRTLAHAGLDPALFAVTRSSAAIGWAKPDPQAFLAIAEALALPPAACCLIDDLAENVAGARLVGMRAYRIDRALPQGDPANGTISSLLDLIGLLTAARVPSHALATYDSLP